MAKGSDTRHERANIYFASLFQKWYHFAALVWAVNDASIYFRRYDCIPCGPCWICNHI